MVYAYCCDQCGNKFDVIKPVSQYQEPENCKCGYEATRVPFPLKLHLSGTAVQDRVWNPGLGMAVTANEAKAYAKQNGLIEVGNESVAKEADRVAANLEAESDRVYEDVWKGA